MIPEEEIRKELVDPDSDAGSFQAVQNIKPEPFQVSRKELHRRWLRYRRVHRHITSINLLHQPVARHSLCHPDVIYSLYRVDARYSLRNPEIGYCLHHPEGGYSLHQPYFQHSLLVSRRAPHA